MSNFTVSAVFVDNLAQFGARPSASTMMRKFVSHIYMEAALLRLKCLQER